MTKSEPIKKAMERLGGSSQPQTLNQILIGKNHEVDGDMTEAELQDKMSKYLSRYFHIYLEVKSTDLTSRIDLVIIHKSDLDNKYPIGVEIKLVAKKRGKDLAIWLKQASRYSEKKFGKFGKCLIVTCPQVSEFYMKEGYLMHKHEGRLAHANNIATFLGQFNIGELQKYYQDGQKMSMIVFKGQVIWDSYRDSFRFHNYDRLCR